MIIFLIRLEFLMNLRDAARGGIRLVLTIGSLRPAKDQRLRLFCICSEMRPLMIQGSLASLHLLCLPACGSHPYLS